MILVRKCLLMVGFVVAPPLQALSPPPLTPGQWLEPFYHAMGGDDWKNNDGWLDPEVDPCNWFGVTCGIDPEWGYEFISELVLPDNNLTGELHETGVIFSSFVRNRLDLSGNRIGGRLEFLDPNKSWIDLSGNHLNGPLPDGPPSNSPGGLPGANFPLLYLDLSGNRFEREVPESWHTLDLLHLDLSNNRLEGMPEAAFLAMHRHADSGFLGLADNRFAGPLPHSIVDTGLLPHNKGTRGGGLNLCWNEFLLTVPLTPEEAPIEAWIKGHHVGGENYGDCAWRERAAMDATVSGTWYDPARSGEGVVLHLLDRGEPLLYWFTFDEEGGQRWLVEVGEAGDSHFRWSRLYETRGDFSRGFSATHPMPLQERGAFRFDRTGPESAHVERVYYDPNQEIICLAVFPPPAGCFVDSYSDRLEHFQLTRLAGSTCESRRDEQWMSGVWRSRDASGEGFIVEVLEDGRAVVFWFTYTPDGSGRQAWMMGDGTIDGNAVVVDLIQPKGASFGGDFDRDAVIHRPWGEIRLEFAETRDGGQALWRSDLEEYGSGDYAIERLARPMLADCHD